MTNFKRYSELPFIAVIVPPGAFAYSAPRVTLYFNALRRGGALPFALPLTQDEELLASQLAGADGLLISGGIDIDPELYGGNGTGRSVMNRNSICMGNLFSMLPSGAECRFLESAGDFRS